MKLHLSKNFFQHHSNRALKNRHVCENVDSVNVGGSLTSMAGNEPYFGGNKQGTRMVCCGVTLQYLGMMYAVASINDAARGVRCAGKGGGDSGGVK